MVSALNGADAECGLIILSSPPSLFLKVIMYHCTQIHEINGITQAKQ